MGLFSSIGSAIGDVVSAVGGGSVVGPLISGAASLIGGDNANSANAASVANQEAFQEDMSGTAYQRSKADMVAADLNPALMYGTGGPASVPTGSTYTSQNALGNAATSAVQTAQADATVQNLQAQVDKTKADTALSMAQAQAVKQQTILSAANAANVEATTQKTQASLPEANIESKYYSSTVGRLLTYLKLGLGHGNSAANAAAAIGDAIPAAGAAAVVP